MRRERVRVSTGGQPHGAPRSCHGHATIPLRRIRTRPIRSFRSGSPTADASARLGRCRATQRGTPRVRSRSPRRGSRRATRPEAGSIRGTLAAFDVHASTTCTSASARSASCMTPRSSRVDRLSVARDAARASASTTYPGHPGHARALTCASSAGHAPPGSVAFVSRSPATSCRDGRACTGQRSRDHDLARGLGDVDGRDVLAHRLAHRASSGCVAPGKAAFCR